MRTAKLTDIKEAVARGVITAADGDRLAAARAAVKLVIEVDDFAPEALSPPHRDSAGDAHQFFQHLGEQRAAS